jgi:hypothetical protein
MRNTGIIDRMCRRLLDRAMKAAPEKNFMRDQLIDDDFGYDPAELDRYQRGESNSGSAVGN